MRESTRGQDIAFFVGGDRLIARAAQIAADARRNGMDDPVLALWKDSDGSYRLEVFEREECEGVIPEWWYYHYERGEHGRLWYIDNAYIAGLRPGALFYWDHMASALETFDARH